MQGIHKLCYIRQITMRDVNVCKQHSFEHNVHVNKIYSSIRILYSMSTSCNVIILPQIYQL